MQCSFKLDNLILLALLEGGGGRILSRDDRIDSDLQRPGDGKIHIIPKEGTLGIRAVGSRDLVVEIGGVAHHQKTMSASGRYPESFVGVGCQIITIPDTERRGVLPEIHKHVENGSGSDPDKLALGRVPRLIMETAEHMLGGAGVVVLNEIRVDAERAKRLAVPGLQKKAPCVPKDLRLQEVGVVDLCGNFLHGEISPDASVA